MPLAELGLEVLDLFFLAICLVVTLGVIISDGEMRTL
jgi:hypothetical protein